MEIAVAFTLPKLAYAYDALEPHIDAQTMEIHHTKHHQTYINNANAALEGTEWADRSAEDIIANLDALPEDKRGPLRNNAGGHANHSLFWTVMSPKGGGQPVGEAGAHQRARRGEVGVEPHQRLPTLGHIDRADPVVAQEDRHAATLGKQRPPRPPPQVPRTDPQVPIRQMTRRPHRTGAMSVPRTRCVRRVTQRRLAVG